MLQHFHVVCTIALLHLLGVTNALALQSFVVQNKLVDNRDCPSMFVAVLSSLDSGERRAEIRSMWTTAASAYANDLEYRFILCTAGGISEELQKEQDTYNDTVFLDCEEGYLNGILTRKVASSMKYYLENFWGFELYMKIDDDAYLSTDRLCSFMDAQKRNGSDVTKAYMGVFAEGHEKVNAEHPVIRDPKNSWYEPYSKYHEENYPVSAKGGPGYILPLWSVEEIIYTNISSHYELNNEDKAVGYWVTKLSKHKIEQYINLPGTDGYEEHQEYNSRHNCTHGTFGGYPLLVHHHLEGSAINCMHEVEWTRDPNALIDPCFELSLFEPLGNIPFGSIPKEHVRIHMPY